MLANLLPEVLCCGICSQRLSLIDRLFPCFQLHVRQGTIAQGPERAAGLLFSFLLLHVTYTVCVYVSDGLKSSLAWLLSHQLYR